MTVDVCTLMYLTFQRARHADPFAPIMLRTLATVLEAVEQQRTFTLDLADFDLADHSVFGDVQESMYEDGAEDLSLNAANEPFLSLAKAAVDDLRALRHPDDEAVMRTLGYALHNVPQFIADPACFNPLGYRFCVALLFDDFGRLSPELKASLARVMGLDPSALEQVVSERRWD